MMENHTGVKAGRVGVAFVFTLLLVLLLTVKFDIYYDLNDDTMIKDIVSGAYTGIPSGYCIQMLYPLGWFIALFYKAIPNAAWYGLFLCLCQFGVIFLVAVRLLEIMRRASTKIMALAAEAALVMGIFLRSLVMIQYSVTSGICMAGAVFLFITTPKVDKPSVFFRRNLLPLFLVVLAFMIRTEVCIMLMPFLLLAGLVKWLSEDKIFTGINFKKYIMLIVMAVLCMAAVYSLDMLAYRSSEWSSFRGFFDARTKLYDFYGLPEYDKNIGFYEAIGLSRESYALLENYNFALDESIDTWRLKAIVEYQEKLAVQNADGQADLKNTFGFVSKNSISEALWSYKNQILNDFLLVKALLFDYNNALSARGGLSARVIAEIAVLAAYFVYIFVCFIPAEGKNRFMSGFKITCLLIVRGILWLYLYMVDRLPDRVTMPLLLMELVVIAGFGISDSLTNMYMKSSKAVFKTAFKTARMLFYVLCIVAALIAFNGNLQRVQAEYNNRAAADRRWNALMDYCRKNGNNYYIIDVYSSTSYKGAFYSEKVFVNVDNSFKNFDICGGWLAKSPLAKQKLAKIGLKDVQGALIGKKAYFTADTDKDLEWLVQYYKNRGITIKPECIDRIQTLSGETAFEIYEITRLQNK